MSGASVLTLPAPGWYTDPAGVAALRWWDGAVWTEGTHDAAPLVTPVQPVVVETRVEPVPVEPVVFEAAVFAPAPAPAAAPTPAPAAAVLPRSTAYAHVVRRGVSAAKTRWSTILTAYPFVYPFAVGTIVGLAYAGGSSTSPSTLALIAGATAFVLLLPTFLLAERDRKELSERGYHPTPSSAWLLLFPPIAYLMARRRLVGPA
ncbi:MAG: DUF2510 domain-containing protein [Pseudolysinimonas sp.]